MPMERYLYHGEAVGFDADIWEPGPYKVDGHARCGVVNRAPGKWSAQQDKYDDIPAVISHGGCSSVVSALDEDSDGFFRTEIKTTLNDLKVEGDALTATRIVMGMVTMYKREWYERSGPKEAFARVIPYGCEFEGLAMKGKPVDDPLAPPFHYSTDQCEAYLRGATRDPKMDAEIRQAIADSGKRFKYVKNFGRIFFGEWTVLPDENWYPTHRISMIRLAMGSPQSGGGSGGGSSGGGGSDPPPG